MREILFRGQRDDTKEWVEGNLINWNSKLKPRIIWFELIGVINDPDQSETNFEVIPETIGQYTGLLDKNGVKIFTGHILSDRWKVEVYQNDEGTFMVKFHTNPNRNKPMTLKKYLAARELAGTSTCEGYRDCIIVANIHDNKDLLT